MKLKMKEKDFLYLVITVEFILSMILYAIMMPAIAIMRINLINQNVAYEFGISLYILIIGAVLYSIISVFAIFMVFFVAKQFRDFKKGLDEL